MALLGNPQDVLTTPYGYSGQMAPETAIAEQALNRRRLLANMLTQQGLQPQQGRMVGRFYAAPSPVQGGAGLAQVLAGTLGNRMIDSQQGDLMEKDRQMVADAIKNWKARQSQPIAQDQAPVSAAPSQAPPPALEPALPSPPSLPEGSDQGAAMQNVGPRPQNIPDQHTGVSDYRAPGFVGTTPSGISPDVTPGDMSTMVNSADPAKGMDQLGGVQSAPPPQAASPMPAPAPAPVQRKTTMDDLAELMTHQHPQVRAYGQFLAQQMQRDQDMERADRHRQEDIGLKMLEHNTPSGSAKMMSEAQQATAKELNLQRRDDMNLRHQDQQEKLAQDAAHYKSVDAFNAAKLKLDAQQARERNAVDKEIAQARVEAKQQNRPLPGSIGQKFTDNSSNLRMAERALALSEGKTVDGAAGDKNATGWKGLAPDFLLQRADPSGVDTRAAISNLGSMVIHDRSGAAVTAAEYPRLRPFIPSATDSPDVAQKKLRQFVQEYKKVTEEMGDFYTEAGYNVPKMFHKSPNIEESGSSTAQGGASLDDLLKKYAQ